MMLARLLPLLVLCACASTAPLPTADRPELARLVIPYADRLRAVGITRVVSPGSGAMVRLETLSGPVYVPYPRDVAPLAFVLDVDSEGVRAASSSSDLTVDARALAAILPVAIRETASNNVEQWIRANPWH